MTENKKFFRGNSALKGKGVSIEWTPEMVQEYIKCEQDIFYFVENFFFIVTENGLEKMELRDYQVEFMDSMVKNRNTLACFSRQSGKTECFRAFVLWYILFHDYKTIAILSNKLKTAKEVINKIQLSYRNLPYWLQKGVVDFNKESFVLENESRVFAEATSPDALRSFTPQIVIVDECAHVGQWESFWTSVSPTLSAGKETKLIFASTPYGLNHFYEFFQGSQLGKGTNDFHAIFAPWNRVPGRDEKWKEGELRRLKYDYAKFDQEFNCSFIGSSGTLISGHRLELLRKSIQEPIHELDNLKLYEMPIKESKEWRTVEKQFPKANSIIYEQTLRINQEFIEKEFILPSHSYAIVADVSRGKGLDYSAFSIIDITQLPYKQVATFRNNDITPSEYAEIILKAAQFYNNAVVLTEINDIGEQVSSVLLEQFEYENILYTKGNGRAGKKIVLDSFKADRGLRTTTVTKNSGCLLMKLLIEEEKLLIYDENTINELMTFSRDKNTYKAESGHNDDLAMSLVLFSWLSDQEYFKEALEHYTVAETKERDIKKVEEKLFPLGFIKNDNTITNIGGRIPEPQWNSFIGFRDREELDINPEILYLNDF